MHPNWIYQCRAGADAIALIGAIHRSGDWVACANACDSAHTHMPLSSLSGSRALDSNRNWHWNIWYVVAKCDCVMVCSRNTQCARRKRFRVRVRTYCVCLRLSSQIWHRIWTCARRETGRRGPGFVHTAYTLPMSTLYIQFNSLDWRLGY